MTSTLRSSRRRPKLELPNSDTTNPRNNSNRVSKSIVTQYPHSLIGLEHLTDIRERTPCRKRDKRGKHVGKKQRKANATYSKWSFAELQSMIAYKALRAGSMAIKVDANYTSKACPMCGHTCD